MLLRMIVLTIGFLALLRVVVQAETIDWSDPNMAFNQSESASAELNLSTGPTELMRNENPTHMRAEAHTHINQVFGQKTQRLPAKESEISP